MEKKLFKEVDFYGLKIDDKIVGLNNDSTNKLLNYPFKLSLKNCQAIEDGYDLDEIIEQTKQTLEDSRISSYDSFRIGMETILKILGDKKYSEEDVKKAILFGEDNTDITSSDNLPTEEVNKFIQSLQQTEWDVEVEMEDVFVHSPSLSPNQKSQWEKKPKLDADGCLILKRI